MHALCSEGTGNMTRLAKCPRDFVEAPSQMLENWCWQKSILERLSKHHETGQPLPDEMLQSMIRAKHVNVAFHSLRQIYLARLDLTIHGVDPPKDAAGLQALVDKLRPEISLIENPAGNNMLRTFSHLMNQYSASYVSCIAYCFVWEKMTEAHSHLCMNHSNDIPLAFVANSTDTCGPKSSVPTCLPRALKRKE